VIPVKQKVLGIDISDTSAEVLCLQKGAFGKPYLHSYNRASFHPEIFSDGKILHKTALSEILGLLKMRARPYSFRGGLCCVSIPDSRFFIHSLHIPSHFGQQERRRGILHEMQKKLPLSLRDVYYDCKEVGRRGENKEYVIAAIPKEIVHDYTEVLHRAGLLPLAFDMESASLGRGLLHNNDKNSFVAIVDIGKRYCNVGLFDNLSFVHSHTVPQGIATLARTVAKEMDISENFAMEKHLSCDTPYSKDDSLAFEIVYRELRQIIGEIKRIIQHHYNERGAMAEKIILTGGIARMPRMQKVFQSHFRQPIEVRNPLERIWLKGYEYRAKKNDFFGNIIGLGLRGLSREPHREWVNVLKKA